MTPTEIRISVRTLQAQGRSLREISRLLRLSRNTVRRILRKPDTEPRNIYAAGAEAVSKVERNMCNAVNARRCHPAGVEEHITCKRNAPEAGRSRVWPEARLDSGPHREGEEP